MPETISNTDRPTAAARLQQLADTLTARLSDNCPVYLSYRLCLGEAEARRRTITPVVAAAYPELELAWSADTGVLRGYAMDDYSTYMALAIDPERGTASAGGDGGPTSRATFPAVLA